MENLENKVGYRILKVLYYLYYIVLIFSIFIWLSSGISSLVEFIFVYLLNIIFNELIHLGLFYIFFGDLKGYNYSITKNLFSKYKKSKNEKLIFKNSENKEIEISKKDYLELKEIKENIYENISLYSCRRYFAKMFDIFFSYILFSIIPILYFTQKFLFSENLVESINFIVLYVFISPIVYEIIFFSLFRNTVGKTLMGIEITNLDGKRLNFFQSIKRTFLSFIFGLGFRLPIITLFTCITQYKNLNNKEKKYYTGYDYGNFIVKYKIKIGILKKIIVFIFVTIYFGILMILNSLPKINEEINKEKIYPEVSKEIENRDIDTKTEKELFLEELKKISGIKNEKIDELTTHTERKLEESNGKYTFVYIYKSIEEKSYFLDNFSEIVKGETINNFREIKKTNKEAKQFMDMSIKHNIYYGFKYYDKNNDLISYFEISPKELSEIDNIIEKPENNKNILEENNNYTWYTARDLIRYDINLYDGVILENTNLRKTPSINGEKIGLLKKGEDVKFSKDEIVENDGYKWIAVYSDNTGSGWAVIDWIKQMN